MNDIVKAAIVLPAYTVVGPALGFAIAGKRSMERLVFCAMLFLTALYPTKFTLMLGSIETYRGHTKGFEFSFIEVLAIAILVASWKGREQGWKLMAPGAWIYLAWCALMSLSIYAAYSPLYGWMAVVKFTKVVLLLLAGFHFLRSERDLTSVLRTMAVMVIMMGLICLKMRLLEGRFRTVGLFEHQNPMAMWCYFLAMPLLAVGLRPQTPKGDAWFYLAGVAAAGICVLLSVSRAALGAFGVGCVLVLALGYLRGFSKRLVGVSILGLVGAVFVAAFALNSVFDRMKEESMRDDVGEADLREVMIDQARAMLHDSAVGIGWNNYGITNSRPIERYSLIMEEWDAARGFRVYEENYVANPLTESYYWLILGENGYPGFIGCVAFLGATLLFAVRALRWHWRTAAGWFLGGVCVTLALHYGHSMVERVLVQTKNLSLWMMTCGLVARLETLRRQGQHLPAGQ